MKRPGESDIARTDLPRSPPVSAAIPRGLRPRGSVPPAERGGTPSDRPNDAGPETTGSVPPVSEANDRGEGTRRRRRWVGGLVPLSEHATQTPVPNNDTNVLSESLNQALTSDVRSAQAPGPLILGEPTNPALCKLGSQQAGGGPARVPREIDGGDLWWR